MKDRLTRLIWNMDDQAIDLKRDKARIIHHTLALGTLEDIRHLFRLYPRREVRRIFLQGHKGLYDRAAFAFARLLLNTPSVDSKRYMKNIRGSSF